MPLSAPPTPRLGLPIFSDVDAFSHTDFNNQNNILDEYPGPFICTSTTHPSWGAHQVGMQIFESDTGRSLWWTGTTFKTFGGSIVGAGFRYMTVNSTIHQVASTLTTASYTFSTSTSGPTNQVAMPARCALLFHLDVNFYNRNSPSGINGTLQARPTFNGTAIGGADYWATIDQSEYREYGVNEYYYGPSTAGNFNLGFQVQLTSSNSSTFQVIVENATLAFWIIDLANGGF